MDKLIEDKMTIVLNLIRTNNTADEVLKITQAFLNLASGRNVLEGLKAIRTKGAGS
jgi:hypothetical protein